jgi:hypothetical protein
VVSFEVREVVHAQGISRMRACPRNCGIPQESPGSMCRSGNKHENSVGVTGFPLRAASSRRDSPATALEYLHKLEQLCLFMPEWRHKSTGEPVMYLDQDFYRSSYRDLKELERLYLTRPLAENEPPHPKVPTYPETSRDYGFNK